MGATLPNTSYLHVIDNQKLTLVFGTEQRSQPGVVEIASHLAIVGGMHNHIIGYALRPPRMVSLSAVPFLENWEGRHLFTRCGSSQSNSVARFVSFGHLGSDFFHPSCYLCDGTACRIEPGSEPC